MCARLRWAELSTAGKRVCGAEPSVVRELETLYRIDHRGVCACLSWAERRTARGGRNRTLATLVETEASGGFVEDAEGGWSKNGAVNKSSTSLQNILMQMRKNCNHPYLFQVPNP